MDDLYLDGPSVSFQRAYVLIFSDIALGITDEADLMELKGTRKKKGKKIDDPDFMVSSRMTNSRVWMLIVTQPTLHPLVKKDVPKVMQAIRQTQSRKVLLKLLTRLKVQASIFVLSDLACLCLPRRSRTIHDL